MFSRSMILAGALAAALVPAAAAPARAADPADVAKLVGGLATLYIIGRAVKARADDDDEDDERRHRDARDPDREWRESRHGEWRDHEDRHDDRVERGYGARYGRAVRQGAYGGYSRGEAGNGSKPHHLRREERGSGRPGAGQRRHATLPVACERRMRVRHEGSQIVMGPGCLARAGYSWRDLPQRCRVTVRSRNGLREAYTSRCLQRAGYRIRD